MNMNDMVRLALEKAASNIDTNHLGGGFCVVMDENEVLAKAHAIIFDGDLTAVAWEDGSVTRTHRVDDDEYDPLFGTMACIVRKLSNNRGHAVDNLEEWMHEVAGEIHSTDDLDSQIDELEGKLNALRTLRINEDKWLPQLGKPEAPKPKPAKPKAVVATDYNRKVDTAKLMEATLHNQEMTRQEIRNLIDNGEL